MTIHEELTRRHPIRRTEEQKHAFRQWAIDRAGQAGYSARVEENGRAQIKNVIIGDPDSAAVIFSAHYDTPSRMLIPDMKFPRSIPVAVCLHMLLVLLGIAISVAVLSLVHLFTPDGYVLFATFVLCYVGLLVLISCGPANRNNANESSGVAALLQLIAALPEEDRDKCAFILFDGGTKGRTGSKAWAKDHAELAWMRLLVDLDKVGVGDHALLVSSSMARRCTGFNTLEKVLAETPGLTAHFYDGKTTLTGGDSRSFKCGVALMVCEQRPGLGFVIGRIATARDTLCEQRCLDWVVTGLTGFVRRMGKE